MKVEEFLAPCADEQALRMRCEEGSAFVRLREEWDALHRASADATPFTSWEWLYSWWQAYGEPKALRLLTWRLEGALVGVVPLYLVRRKTKLGTAANVLRLVGDGSSDSDYLGLTVRSDVSARVIQQLCEWLAGNRECDVLELRELSEASASAAVLEQLAQRYGFRFRAEHSDGGFVQLPDTFEEFLHSRAPRFRTKLRSLLRTFEETGLRLEVEAVPANLRRRLRSLFVLHQQRWTHAGAGGVFGAAAKRVFYAHFVPRFARKGWLRFYSLKAEDRYVAHQLCFGSEGTTYLLQEGFDVSDPSASYGQMLRAAVIRHLIETGERRYDFLGGLSRHKQDWGAQRTRSVHLTIARAGWRAWLYFSLPVWRERCADVVKRLRRRTDVRMMERNQASS